jgi:hypothetical protein
MSSSTLCSEGKRQLLRRIITLKNNSKMGVKEVGGGGAEWIQVAQDRAQWCALVDMVTNLWGSLLV